MTLGFAVVLAAAELEDHDLVGTTLSNNRSTDRSTFYHWRAYGHIVAVGQHQHLVDNDLAAYLAFQLFNL